jgi:DNA-binding IclR family transcriptional regulator
VSQNEQDRDFVTALARGLSILQSFTPEHPEMGTSEIATKLGLPQSTVWRLCYTLQKLGFLEPTSADKLCVGNAALTLGFAAMQSSDMAQYAFPLMEEIALRYDMGVSLAVRYDADMLLVQRAAAPATLQLNVRVGSRLPIVHSALGWAYLCSLDETERHNVLQEVAAAHPDEYKTWMPKLPKVFEQYQRDGYLLALRTLHPAVHAVSIPLAALPNKPPMAISCAGVAEIAPIEKLITEIVPALQSLAAKLDSHRRYAN